MKRIKRYMVIEHFTPLHILAGILPIGRSNKAMTPMKLGGLEEKLTF
jgi:hypothetical protein